ncbi:MAG: hypothetical protein NVS1B13_01840 [Flavisolibacter sp.]
MQTGLTDTGPSSSDLFQEDFKVYAGFWERFGAAVLDGLILIIPNYLLQLWMGNGPATYYFISILIRWLYDALQESGQNQATIGKKALAIKVTDLQGQRISFLKASGRHFGKYLSAVILLMGYFMMIWDKNKQTLHDKMAGTLVVKM